MTLPAGSDDTIEIVLTPEQLLSLERAAEEAKVAAAPTPAAVVAVPSVVISHPLVPVIVPTLDFAPRLTRRERPWHQTPLAKMAANTLAFVGFAWWSVSQLAGEPQAHHAPVAVAAAKPVVAVHPVVATSPAPPPATAVHVVNPFDRSEVFEFPPGTSAEEGRQKVAQILLERARERLNRWERGRPVRTANNTAVSKVIVPGP